MTSGAPATVDPRVPRRPPAVAILIGLVEAIVGGIATVVAAWPAIYELAINLPFLTAHPRGGEYLWLTFTSWCVMILGACAFLAGMRLLHSDPRGRTWTFRLGVAGLVFIGLQIPWFMALPDLKNAFFSSPSVPLVYLAVIVGGCLFALAAMHSKRVREFYSR